MVSPHKPSIVLKRTQTSNRVVFDLLAFLKLVIHGVGSASAVVSSLDCGYSEGLRSSDEWFEVLSLKRTHLEGTQRMWCGFIPRVLLL